MGDQQTSGGSVGLGIGTYKPRIHLVVEEVDNGFTIRANGSKYFTKVAKTTEEVSEIISDFLKK